MPTSYSGTAITWPDSSTTTSGWTGFKNRIINGAMVINQRAGGTVTIPATTDTYTLDRWKCYASQASKFTVQQSSTAPVGFINSLLVTSSSAYTVGSSEEFDVIQVVEGLNCTDLAWGTASAKTVTLSAWVYSSLTGTFGGSLRNSAANRSYPFSYTISSANTWTQISVTIAGDTTGTWLTTSGAGIYVNFSMGAGSTMSNTAGAWVAGNYTSATGATSVVGTNGATFYITGVQLERGSTASSFEYRPYGTELALCQRYYTRFITNGDIYTFFGSGGVNSTTNGMISAPFPVAMRSSPTISFGNIRVYDMYSGYSISAVGTNRSSTTSLSAEFTISGATVGRPCMVGANNNSAGYLDASAEL